MYHSANYAAKESFVDKHLQAKTIVLQITTVHRAFLRDQAMSPHVRLVSREQTDCLIHSSVLLVLLGITVSLEKVKHHVLLERIVKKKELNQRVTAFH